jgi:hypothetical protein
LELRGHTPVWSCDIVRDTGIVHGIVRGTDTMCHVVTAADAPGVSSAHTSPHTTDRPMATWQDSDPIMGSQMTLDTMANVNVLTRADAPTLTLTTDGDTAVHFAQDQSEAVASDAQ